MVPAASAMQTQVLVNEDLSAATLNAAARWRRFHGIPLRLHQLPREQKKLRKPIAPCFQERVSAISVVVRIPTVAPKSLPPILRGFMLTLSAAGRSWPRRELPPLPPATTPSALTANTPTRVGEAVFRGIGRYHGDLRGGVRVGHGTFQWESGARYFGQWRADVMDGYGEAEWGEEQRYAGFWANGLPHGQGCMTWGRDGAGEAARAEGGRYAGEFACGRRHGRGCETQAQRGMYEGMFSDDARVG
jgi:hypothetical protein